MAEAEESFSEKAPAGEDADKGAPAAADASAPSSKKADAPDSKNAAPARPPAKKQPLSRRIASLLIGFVIACAFGEIAVRVAASQTHIYNIEMVRYATELKEPDPRGEVSHVHRHNASAELMGVEVSLNSLGHRGPDLPPKSPDRKRVLVLGSSVTMGWGVPYDQTFTKVVEDRWNKELPLGPNTHIEIANAGIGNYNTFAQSRLFYHQYPEVKPDLVVLHYFISDAEPRPPGKNSFILRHSFFAAYCYDRVRTIELAAEGKGDLFKYYSNIYDDAQPYWSETLARITEMRDMAAKDGVPFIIMIIPDFHNLAPGTPYGSLYAKMEKGFSDRGFTEVNAFPPFQTKYGGHESDLWIQRDDPHPNALGHALMADLLYEALTKPGAFTLNATSSAGHQ